jgi:hypothetical protein
LNTAKCRHTAVNEPSPQNQPPLGVRTAGTSTTRAHIPRTAPTGTFKYLGHQINQNGNWASHEAAVAVKLGAAMQQVKLAAGDKVCHTLWTAMFTECDGGSELQYHMAAAGLSESCLQKLNTAQPARCEAHAGGADEERDDVRARSRGGRDAVDRKVAVHDSLSVPGLERSHDRHRCAGGQ